MTPNVLIVEARFYSHISDALLDGATAALVKAGVHFERITVPGALEIPPAILFAAQAGPQTQEHGEILLRMVLSQLLPCTRQKPFGIDFRTITLGSRGFHFHPGKRIGR